MPKYKYVYRFDIREVWKRLAIARLSDPVEERELREACALLDLPIEEERVEQALYTIITALPANQQAATLQRLLGGHKEA